MLPMTPLSTSGHMIICKEEEVGVFTKVLGGRREGPSSPSLSAVPRKKPQTSSDVACLENQCDGGKSLM